MKLKVKLIKLLTLFCMILLVTMKQIDTDDFRINPTKIEENSNDVVNLINEEISDLITNIDKKQNEQKSLTKDKEYNGYYTGNNNDLHSDILNVFQSLNHDFLEYEDLLNLGEKNSTEVETLRNSYKEYNEKYATKSEFNYYSEVGQLTTQIEQTLKAIDKIDDNDKEEIKLKTKIKMIQSIKQTLSELKQKLTHVKENKILVKEKINKVKQMFNKILILYDDYISLEKDVDSNLKKNLSELENEYNDSHFYSTKIVDYTKYFNKIESFYLKLNNTDSNTEKQKYLVYNTFIKQINTMDESNEILKNKIQKEIEITKKMNLTHKNRVIRLNELLKLLQNLKTLNNHIITIKMKITNNLRKIKVDDFNNFIQLLEVKEGMGNQKQKKLIHLQNTLQIGKKIFEDKDTILKIRINVMKNLNESQKIISEHEEQLKSRKELHEIQELQETKLKLTLQKEAEEQSENLSKQLIEHINSNSDSRKNTSDEDELNIRKLHDLSIKRFSAVYMYIQQLRKLKEIFEDKKEKIELNLKIEKSMTLLNSLKKIIENSKTILKQIEKSNELKKEYRKEYYELTKNAEQLKADLKTEEKEMSHEKLEGIRKKLNKLSVLYKYLKRGSIHNFIQSELLKKIVNMNLTLLNQFDIEKFMIEVKLLK
jgi:hypothetical protein